MGGMQYRYCEFCGYCVSAIPHIHPFYVDKIQGVCHRCAELIEEAGWTRDELKTFLQDIYFCYLYRGNM